MPVRSVPLELVDDIVKYAIEYDPVETSFTRQTNLLAFARVSKSWLAVSAPLLLQHPNSANPDMVDEFSDFCLRYPRVRNSVKSMTFRLDRLTKSHTGDNEFSFIEDILDNFYRGVQTASFLYAAVRPRQRYCLPLQIVQYSFGAKLTTLVLAHLELQMPETIYDIAQFPQLLTLDLRHNTIQTPEAYFLYRLNARVPDLLLPVGTRRFSPCLRELHICASGLGGINVGDFTPVADQITLLSLGVLDDSAFLRPSQLDKFTSLETFEFWWPLYSDVPFENLAPNNNITELRIRDRWDRFPRGEWDYASQNYVELEWSEGGSVLGDPNDNDDNAAVEDGPSDDASQASDSEEQDSSSEHFGESPYPESSRFAQIARKLVWALERDNPPFLPSLERLVLPLKFQQYFPGGKRHAISRLMMELEATLDNLGIELMSTLATPLDANAIENTRIIPLLEICKSKNPPKDPDARPPAPYSWRFIDSRGNSPDLTHAQVWCFQEGLVSFLEARKEGMYEVDVDKGHLFYVIKKKYGNEQWVVSDVTYDIYGALRKGVGLAPRRTLEVVSH